MRKLIAAAFVSTALLAACPALAQANLGAPAVGAPTPVPNGQGGLVTPAPTIPATPPAQPNGCAYMGSAQCPIYVGSSVFNYAHIATSTTTVLASAGGHYLHEVCVNKAGTTGSVTIDDAASATTPTIGVLDSTVARCSDFDVQLTTGLTIVTTGAPDVTVSWR